MCDPIFCFVQIVSYELVSGDTVRVSVRPQGSTVNRYRFSAVSPQGLVDVPTRLPFSCHMSQKKLSVKAWSTYMVRALVSKVSQSISIHPAQQHNSRSRLDALPHHPL